MVPTKAPSRFSEAIFLEGLEIIKKHPAQFKEGAELQYARLCGGEALESALNLGAKPPCGDDIVCQKCWLEKWCIHKHKSETERLAEIVEEPVEKVIQATIVSKPESARDIDPSKGYDDL